MHTRCAVVAWLILSSGCATIAHGTRQTVTVTSDPSGATVTVLSGGTVESTPGVTPIKLNLTRRDSRITIRLEKDGCPPADVRVKRTTSGWVFGNLVYANPFAMQGYDRDPAAVYALQVAVGLPVVFGIDFATGGAFKLPKVIDVPLCRPGAAR